MAPKDKDSHKKQKTLLGFFSKANVGGGISNASTGKVGEGSSGHHSISSSQITKAASSDRSSSPSHAQESKRKVGKSVSDATPDALNNAQNGSSPQSTRSSMGSTQVIDVDMDEDESDDHIRITGRKKKPLKRKIVDDDEEEEDADLDKFAERLSQYKKPVIMSAQAVDLNKMNEDSSSSTTRPRSSTVSQRKKRRTSVASSDDDDFIASDHEIDSDLPREPKARSRTVSTSSRSSSGSSSGLEVGSDDDLMGEGSRKKASKKGARPPSRPTATKSTSASLFLTAAEQRTQSIKMDKKEAEDCYSFLLDIKDKDGNPEGSPGYDPRTLFIPKEAWKKFTPFEKQFWEIKQNHWDTVLFFQKGKFYELYENDAEIGHRVFDLKMTDRVKMKMVGVPEGKFDSWAARFLAKGYKVGRVDQAETSLGAEMRIAASKGKGSASGGGGKEIVRRELNKVLTAGTLVDGNMISDDQAGHCVSIKEDEEDTDVFGVCILDASTGEFNLCHFTDDPCRTKLETIMRQLRPKEIVHMKGNLTVPTLRLLRNILPGKCLWTALRAEEGMDYDESMKALEELFPSDSSSSAVISDGQEAKHGMPQEIQQMLGKKTAIEAIGAMIWYLRQLRLDKDLLSMRNFNVYDPMREGQGLLLDGQTLSHIEVLQNSEGTEDGTLLKLLNRCVTPFGKRLFRIWLCMPLRDISAINERLDAVDELMSSEADNFHKIFTDVVKRLPDLERIISRVHAGSCKVADFLKVLHAFNNLNKGFERLIDASNNFRSGSLRGLLKTAPSLDSYIKNIQDQFVRPADKEDSTVDELLPAKGKDEDYDAIEDEIKDLDDELQTALQRLSKKTGIKLTYWNSSLGMKDIYLVQTPTSSKGIPKDWQKASGTKALNRWHVPELASMIRKFKEAHENRNAAIKRFKLRLYDEFDSDRDIWLQAVKVIAEVDCLVSLCKASLDLGEPSCRPQFVECDQAFVEFVQLRHPSLCLKTDSFIPNDIKMGGEAEGIMLLTGANMAGKSTLMRMTAAGIIMAQLGMYVPAASARLAPIDKILTRMGAYDNMFTNSSTFRVEMDEACKILRDATPKSLIVLDELGRGTSTFDGMAIAGAVLHDLATHTLGLALFATHYSGLTEDFQYHCNVRNMHMATAVDGDKREIVFLYKLVAGTASSSFGTHVANLAGVPSSVVKRAETISRDFALQFQKRMAAKKKSALPLLGQADFAYLWGLAGGRTSVQEPLSRQNRVFEVLRKATLSHASV
ncbi:DNA mismatch repair protein msh6 [Tulasnella sp. 419]|nr:DNA mismatch repair protein msh6 [Tulasnella sp. 418]KAG8966978.1 DNA mismatch repair protein msh6 [Tulasnella sp. 419]